MSSMMTTWPNTEKSAGVSSVMRPVTQTADTAVKSASTAEIARPSAADTGSRSKMAPTRMRPAMLKASS